MAISYPSSPSYGQEFLASNGYLYWWTGTAWTTRENDNPIWGFESGYSGYNNYVDSTAAFVVNFRYRTIYTRGYACCGYKNSSPWKNINRMQYATESTTNLGDLFDYAAAYVNGGFSDYYTYLYGASGAVSGSSTFTSSFNMQTESARSHNTAWDLKASRGDSAVLMNNSNSAGYITGGGSSYTDKHIYATEVMLSGGISSSPTGAPATGFFGSTNGWVVWGGYSAYLNWATESWAGYPIGSTSCDGHGKSLSSKYGRGYVRNGSYATSQTMYVINDINGATFTTTLAPDVAGEENYAVGQTNGYCLGNYNGVQNNNTFRVNYSTNGITALGSDAQPKGHDGMSSGFCSAGSSQLIGGY
jgi:hypothetical protein